MKTFLNETLAGLVGITLAATCQAQAPAFLTNSQVAYFPFNNNALDASGNANNGTLFGSATFGADRFGNPNSALSLPGGAGTGSGVDIPSLDNLPFFPITYSVWFLANSYPSGSLVDLQLVGRDQGCDQDGGAVTIYTDLSHGISNQLTYYSGSQGFRIPGTPPTNEWIQAVVTIDSSSNAIIYVNGAAMPGTGIVPAGSPLDFRIGTAAPGCGGPEPYYVWNGLIDDVRIFNTNLSAVQVQQLYQYEAVPPAPTNNLVAYYPFNGNAQDASGNGNSGTLFGSATFGADRFGNTNSALSLPGGPGTGSGVDIPSLDNLPFFPITYSVWFLASNYPSGASLAELQLVGRDQGCDQDGGAVSIYTDLSHGISNQLTYYSGSQTFRIPGTPPLNEWIQAVVTIDSSSNATIYVNGIAMSGTGVVPAGSPSDFRIGTAAPGCGSGPYFVWDGLIDDVRIYDTNLSAVQVEQLYLSEAPTCHGGMNGAATSVISNGFVIGAVVTDGGCGYFNTPQVALVGGGGTGATAQAVVDNGMVIGVIITDAGTGYSSAPVIVIGGVPLIYNQPQPVTVHAFDPASFSVGAVGGGLSYIWKLNGISIGSNLDMISFSNVVQSNIGSYTVVVTNVFGATTSSVATLDMYPFINIPFAGLETLWGYTNTLTVGAWGTGPLQYQWYDNGIAINGATNSSLTFTDIQPTNSGIYTVVVSSALGSVTNVNEQVVVEPAGVSLGLSPTVTITGVVGQTYIIQRTPDLQNINSWTTITNLTLTAPVQIWVDTNINTALPGNPQEFYRVLASP